MSANKCFLLGNVGKDVDYKTLDSGISVANFTLATTEKGYTDKNGKIIEDKTEWHNIVLWKGLADIAEKYVHKGDKLFIEGKIRTRSYDDGNGGKKYVTEIYGESMEMLTPKQQSENTEQKHPQKTNTKKQEPVDDGSNLPF